MHQLYSWNHIRLVKSKRIQRKSVCWNNWESLVSQGIRERSSHPKMLAMIKPTSVVSVFSSDIKQTRKHIFQLSFKGNTSQRQHVKDWQRYLDNIRSACTVGSNFCWRIKEKKMWKKKHFNHIILAWARLWTANTTHVLKVCLYKV